MKIKKLAKIFCSFIISFLMINVVCVFYYNIPAHVSSQSGVTDHIWESNRFYSKGTEGFAWGKTDSNGFNNLVASDKDDIDVLFVGSSHTEAFHVAQDETFTSRFNENMKKNGINLNGYSIGVASHHFARCLNNFENIADEYTAAKYIVIETAGVEPSIADLLNIENGTFEKLKSTSNPFVVIMQKIPFIRRVYSQLNNIQIGKADNGNNTEAGNTVVIQSSTAYEETLNAALSRVAKAAGENDAQVIILYHEPLDIDAEGNVTERTNTESMKLFESVCESNGIIFLDMHSAFAENYNKTYRLPHGFSNTAVGKGHLNKYGHEVTANELYKLIAELETNNSVES